MVVSSKSLSEQPIHKTCCFGSPRLGIKSLVKGTRLYGMVKEDTWVGCLVVERDVFGVMVNEKAGVAKRPKSHPLGGTWVKVQYVHHYVRSHSAALRQKKGSFAASSNSPSSIQRIQ